MPMRRTAARSLVSRAEFFQQLEGRVLFDTLPFPALNELTDANHTVVRLRTNYGEVDLELYDTEAPVTTSNFITYVTRGAYDESVFHRLVSNFVLQGGGFRVEDGSTPSAIQTLDPIVNEFSVSRSNLARTVAMAKRGGDPNSATSQFFFNLVNNAANLDNQNGGFTVFARVVNDASWANVQAMAGLSTFNFANPAPAGLGFNSNFTQTPVGPGLNIADGLQKAEVANIWDAEIIKPFGSALYYTNQAFYPEGFSGSTINEFLPMTNPTDQAINYQVIARAEVPQGTPANFYNMTLNYQVLKLNGATGTFRVLFTIPASGSTPANSQSTGDLPATISAADLQTALAALSNVGTGNVRVVGSPGTYRIDLLNATASSTGSFEGDPTNLTGGNATLTGRLFDWYRDRVISIGTIPANSRGGITISRFGEFGLPSTDDLIPQGVPYSLEVHANGTIVANLSHYDFGTATGETFTTIRDTTWGFADGQKVTSQVLDFLVWENLNPVNANLQITFYFQNAAPVTIPVATGMYRRGGLSLQDVTQLSSGVPFSVRIVSDIPITAALSHYDTRGEQFGASYLGVPGSGSTRGVLPLASVARANSAPVTGSQTISFFNPGSSSAVITLSAVFDDGSTQDFTPSSLILIGGRRATVDLSLLSQTNDGRRFSLRYSSGSAMVYGSASHAENGDAEVNAFSVFAATKWEFAEGFMDPARAGVDLFETIAVYNPSASASDVTLRFRYTDGFVLTQTFNVGSQRRLDVNLHALQALLDQGANNSRYFYSIEVEGVNPVVAQMWHQDLTLGGLQPSGGFGALGMPVGTLTAMSTLF